MIDKLNKSANIKNGAVALNKYRGNPFFVQKNKSQTPKSKGFMVKYIYAKTKYFT